jgi:hypothetical protein
MKFLNNPEDFFNNIKKLPEVLVDIVYEYVPMKTKVFLNKTNYVENHHMVKTFINKRQYENYVRCMIRRDNSFVLNFIIIENIHIWSRLRKYLYKDYIYRNYIFFLHDYCIENESSRCKQLIENLIQKLGLSKNEHKKNVIGYIKWRH